jgi:hypothetical protein
LLIYFKIIELSDIVIEVLDARDPLGTRCPQVEQLIQTTGKNKKLVLLLNKIGKTAFGHRYFMLLNFSNNFYSRSGA